MGDQLDLFAQNVRALERAASSALVNKPTHTRHRSTDLDTSREAAASRTKVRATQLRILEVLSGGELSDEAIAAIARMEGWFTSASGLRTRRAELVEGGYVERSDTRTTLATGRRAWRWRVTLDGLNMLAGIRPTKDVAADGRYV